MRFFGLIAVLVVTASIAAASGQTQNRSGHDGKPNVELTFTKWIEPADSPNFTGVVGGDIVGRFGGAALKVTTDDSGFTHISAIYIVVGPDLARSLTMRINGVVNTTGKAVFSGRVVDGRLTGDRVHVEWQAISCSEAPNGTCFKGTITIRRGSESSGG